jgi:tRNA (cytidine/uridine-2'-O-)-methyltransferase
VIHIALYEPEIPPNTGNIIRLAANAGFQLHLIEPLGFELDDKRMRRAGLDYHEFANVISHKNYQAFVQAMGERRIYACTSKGTVAHSNAQYQDEDVFLFGPETRGLTEEIRVQCGYERCIKLPMLPGSRSLNLSNAVAVIAYEAWRQLDYVGAEPIGE